MKTLIMLIFILTSLNLYSQSPSWHLLPNSPTGAYRYDDLSFINENTGWVVYNTSFGSGDNGRVYKTTNGGNSWTLQFSVTNVYLRCIGFADSLTGFIGTLGNVFGLHSFPIMYKTSNGGTSWDTVDFGNFRPQGLCGISAFNSNYIFACGRVTSPAFFTKTTNGGVNWITQNMSPYAFELIDCKFFSPDSGFVVGAADTPYANAKGVILFTSNGGSNWIERYHGDRAYDGLWKITFPSRTTGYVSINETIGIDSIFFIKTINGGINWTKFGYPVPQNQNSTQGIGFLNDNIGWTGDGVDVYKTTNGGLSWASDNFAINLNRIRFLNDTIGYAAGQRIYKFTTEPIGIQPISTEIPKQFLLHQNYPNPFNPETKIRFEIPPVGQRHAFDTKLIIYNILGQEIATLVNEQLQPGVYEVEWNASEYPSGIYFYKLQTEKFTETKKLVLLK